MSGLTRTIELHAAVAKRALRRYGVHPLRTVGRLDERAVFVVGSPRSGTSFTARSLGDVPGFADLGEVNALKAAIPAMHGEPAGAAAPRVRRLLRLSQRLAMVAGLRPIEQTPESGFVIPAISAAFPRARFLHLVRDGRDVACSLIERGWLRAGAPGVQARATTTTRDDAGQPYGDYARFWVERDRRDEFGAVSEARRCAWAWRRYNEAVLDQAGALGDRLLQVRYERLVRDPAAVAREIAAFLDAGDRATDLERALSGAHDESVGRWRRDLDADQLAAVEAEGGGLLRALGYEPPAEGEPRA
jgi:hypothetical protein